MLLGAGVYVGSNPNVADDGVVTVEKSPPKRVLSFFAKTYANFGDHHSDSVSGNQM